MPGRKHSLASVLPTRRGKVADEALEWYGDGEKSFSPDDQDGIYENLY